MQQALTSAAAGDADLGHNRKKAQHIVTRGEEIDAAFDDALAALDALRLEHYEDATIRSIIERLGSRVERFFKTAVFPGAIAAETFDTLINRLKAIGIDKTVRRQLHGLRDLYNDAKHDPTAPIRLKRTVDMVTAARAAVRTLIQAGLGATSAPVETVVSRLLWISAYDVYVGGVTEVYVSLPLPEDIFATHLDLVWIKGLEWDAMKGELLATGCFHYGKEHFDPVVYSRFVEEQDFLNAGIWDGDYRQLIRIISKYEDRPTAAQLIPNLRRDHMYVAVLSAIALAAVDIATGVPAPLAVEKLRSQILEHADKVYAMPDERIWVHAAATGLAELIVQLPFASWAHLSGPFWNLWNPKQLIAVVSAVDLKMVPYVIDDANRVVIT